MDEIKMAVEQQDEAERILDVVKGLRTWSCNSWRSCWRRNPMASCWRPRSFWCGTARIGSGCDCGRPLWKSGKKGGLRVARELFRMPRVSQVRGVSRPRRADVAEERSSRSGVLPLRSLRARLLWTDVAQSLHRVEALLGVCVWSLQQSASRQKCRKLRGKPCFLGVFARVAKRT